jgi:phosphoribosylanthranilate isomerase
MGGKMAQRSFLLKLRTCEGSQEVVLAGGLTLETAESLLQDLNEAIRTHQSQ